MSSLEKDRQDLQSTIDALQEGKHAFYAFLQKVQILLIIYLLASMTFLSECQGLSGLHSYKIGYFCAIFLGDEEDFGELGWG